MDLLYFVSSKKYAGNFLFCHCLAADENERKSSTSIGQWRKPQIKPNRMSDDKTEVPPLELLHARKQQKQVTT